MTAALSRSQHRTGARSQVILSPLGMFQPRHSPLHRLRPGPKLLALALIGLTNTVVGSPWATLGAAALAVAAILAAKLPLLQTLARLRIMFAFACGLTLYHAWATTWQRGLELSGNLMVLVLLASVFTACTRSDDLIDFVTAAMTHLARLPLLGRVIRPRAVALTTSIMLRTVPTLWQIHAQTRDAARARGLERMPRAVVVPLALRTVAHAHATGQALHARGILDPD